MAAAGLLLTAPPVLWRRLPAGFGGAPRRRRLRPPGAVRRRGSASGGGVRRWGSAVRRLAAASVVDGAAEAPLPPRVCAAAQIWLPRWLGRGAARTAGVEGRQRPPFGRWWLGAVLLVAACGPVFGQIRPDLMPGTDVQGGARGVVGVGHATAVQVWSRLAAFARPSPVSGQIRRV